MYPQILSSAKELCLAAKVPLQSTQSLFTFPVSLILLRKNFYMLILYIRAFRIQHDIWEQQLNKFHKCKFLNNVTELWILWLFSPLLTGNACESRKTELQSANFSIFPFSLSRIINSMWPHVVIEQEVTHSLQWFLGQTKGNLVTGRKM